MSIPSGWYPDPNDAGMDRFWDGQAWTTEQRRQQPPAAPSNSWSAPTGGTQPSGQNTELGGLFGDTDQTGPGLRGPVQGSNPWSVAPARPSREQDNAWWLEADEVEGTTPGATTGPVPNNQYYAANQPDHDDEPADSRRSKSRGGRGSLRVWLPRIGGVALLLFAVSVAMAEQDRAALPDAPVVDNLDQVTNRPLPPVTTDEGTGLEGDVPNELFPADPSQTPDPLNPPPSTSGSPVASPSAIATATPSPSAIPSKSSTATKPAAPKKNPVPVTPKQIPAVVNPGSAFGPNGLLAVSWTKPSMSSTPKGLRYLVEVRAEGVATKVVRTKSTEAIFRGVPESSCSVTITPYTADRTGKPLKFRCGS